MSTAVANPVIEKQAFRNNSPGWLGVVKIGPKGDDRGASVAPGDIVWLSEAEQILTANAPRKAEDNPFIEQELAFGVDEEGQPVHQRVTPLTPVSENRYVPAGDRPIPATGMSVPPTEVSDNGESPVAAAVQPPQPGTDVTSPAEDEPDAAAIAAREAAVVAAARAGETPAPVVPSRAAAAVEAENAAKVAAQPTPPADVPPTIGGENVTPPVVPPVAPSQTSEAEETAAVVAPEEHAETGAAVQPPQEAVEGEYAATEEVGTPDAPAQAPAPYVPPQEG